MDIPLSLWRMAIGYLPSCTAIWPVPNYTAWWEVLVCWQLAQSCYFTVTCSVTTTESKQINTYNIINTCVQHAAHRRLLMLSSNKAVTAVWMWNKLKTYTELYSQTWHKWHSTFIITRIVRRKLLACDTTFILIIYVYTVTPARCQH